MRYLLVIYNIDEDWTQRPAREIDPILREHASFSEDLRNAGALVASDALQPAWTATTVRLNGDHPLLTDGPYTGSSEQITGFYLIEVADLDDAIAWSTRLARFEENPIEIRPVYDTRTPGTNRPADHT